MGDIVKSLQYIIDGGGEDDIEDGGRVFETASASRSLSKDEDKKEAAFEIESVDEESDKEEEEEEEWEGDDHEELEVEEDGVIASRSLNSPQVSHFLSIDTREEIGSSSSSSSSSSATASKMYTSMQHNCSYMKNSL